MMSLLFQKILNLENHETLRHEKIKIRKLITSNLYEEDQISYCQLLANLNQFQDHTIISKEILIIFKDLLAIKKEVPKVKEEEKERALNLVESLHPDHHDIQLLILEIFQIQTPNDYLEALLQKWIEKKYYLSACSLVVQLNLCSEMYLPILVYPLIPKHMEIVYKYIEKDKGFQIKLLNHLDEINNTVKVNKVLKKVLKNYELPEEECPKYKESTTCKYLRHINKNLLHNDISYDNWKENVLLRVENDVHFQKFLVSELIGERKLERIAYEMIILFGLDLESYNVNKNARLHLPFSHRSFFKYEKNIYPHISFIDNKELFDIALGKLATESLIGFDSEWRANPFKYHPISILQLATRSDIYLFDMIRLNKCLGKDEFFELVNQVFQKESIIKLGYGLHNDIPKLIEYFPIQSDQFLKNYFDLQRFWNYIKANLFPDEIFYKSFRGLSQLCFEVLGIPLDKGEQCSDFERRPLRLNQIVYAALDAYCLIKIYDVCKCKLNGLFYDFEEVMNVYLSKEENKTLPQPQNQVDPVEIPKCIDSIRMIKVKFLVADTLFELGKNLRLLGADTIIMNYVDYKLVVDDYEEERIILATGYSYQFMLNIISKKTIVCIDPKLNVKKQIEKLLEYFKIQIEQNDIFSRCCSCNNANLINIPCNDVKAIMLKKTADPSIKEYQNVKVDMKKGALENGILIKSDSLFNEEIVAEIVKVCIDCGTMFWDDINRSNVKKNFYSLCCDQEIYQPKMTTNAPDLSDDDDYNEDEY